ncbi:MAG: guanylate kinase [Planctomycetota bacterium]|nr:guanylate kinase [Planctomycetota bacterium]
MGTVGAMAGAARKGRADRMSGKRARRRGILFLLVGPSGAGKTTLLRRLMRMRLGLKRLVSTTTRPPRPGEKDGRDYRFVSDEEFREGIRRGLFAEYAKVHGNLYGTKAGEIDSELAKGRDLIKDIDVQGADALRRRYADAVTIFVLPERPADMAARLRGRGSEDSASFRRRMETARQEIRRAADFDYLVINGELALAAGELRAIVEAERCRTRRRWRSTAWATFRWTS